MAIFGMTVLVIVLLAVYVFAGFLVSIFALWFTGPDKAFWIGVFWLPFFIVIIPCSIGVAIYDWVKK